MPKSGKAQTASTLSGEGDGAFWAIGFKLPYQGIHLEVRVDARTEKILRLDTTKLQKE